MTNFPSSTVDAKRTEIRKMYGTRFDYTVKEFKGIIQGSYMDVDFKTIKSRWAKGLEVLSCLIVSISRDGKTFVGRTGSLELFSAPIDIIIIK